MPESRIGYDELLFDRVKQLREIDDWVVSISRLGTVSPTVRHQLMRLRVEIEDMIRIAEAEHAAF